MTPWPWGLPRPGSKCGFGIRPGGPRVPPGLTLGIRGSHLQRPLCATEGPWRSLIRLPRGLGPRLRPDTRPWVLLGACPGFEPSRPLRVAVSPDLASGRALGPQKWAPCSRSCRFVSALSSALPGTRRRCQPRIPGSHPQGGWSPGSRSHLRARGRPCVLS